MCDSSLRGEPAGAACATAACGRDVQAQHVTMHVSDGARERLGRKKKAATERPDTSDATDVRALVIP
jgi:hypothetical protein